MGFAKQLRQLMKEKGITQETLAKHIGYSQRGVSKWINEQAEPTATAIILCANYFDVTTDYLLGLEDKKGVIKWNCSSKTMFHDN